jgi:hypothetical protein
LRVHAKSGDPDFLKWSTVQATMLVGEGASYIPLERAMLASARYWEQVTRWTDQDAANLLHQAFHLLMFERLLGLPLSWYRTIQEFGGGYGAMARVTRRLGFPGRYAIFDLPECQDLQRRYLTEDEAEWGTLERPELFISCYGLSETPVEGRTRFLAQCQPQATAILFLETYEGIDNMEWFRRAAANREASLQRHPFLAGSWYGVITGA